MARLLITDDDPAILGLIRAILEPEGFEIAEAHNGIEAVEAVEHSDFDLLILDIMMPEMDGLEACRRIRQFSDVPIIFLSAHGSIPTAVSAVQKGAVDFLEKPIEPAELIAKINAAVARSVTESVETMHRDRLRARFETLTAREREIIGEILKGDGSETNKQIARTFDLELSTVKMHRSNAFMNLVVHSAAELIRLAQEAGIHAEA